MSSVTNFSDFLTANKSFKNDFKDGGKPLPPARKAMVLTCMDPRVPIEAAMGIKNGDCGVIRNAGGRVTADVLRDIAIARALAGLEEIYIVHHTDCGMTKCDDAFMLQMVEKKLGKVAGEEGKAIDWLTFKDVKQSLADDKAKLKKSPFVADDIALHFLCYDVNTGGLEDVKIE